MKNLLILLVAAGLFITIQANATSAEWIKTIDGQVSCLKITVQGSSLKVVTENGEKKSLPVSSIVSYYTGNKLYVKLPLYNLEIKGDVFMEFVRSNEDLSLYKYAINGTDRFFVYKGDQLYVALNNGNKTEFEKFFFVQI
jgi:hypothetical protein